MKKLDFSLKFKYTLCLKLKNKTFLKLIHSHFKMLFLIKFIARNSSFLNDMFRIKNLLLEKYHSLQFYLNKK